MKTTPSGADALRKELIADLREVFDASGQETPQIVRDVIEYADSWLSVYIQKGAESAALSAAQDAPAAPEISTKHGPWVESTLHEGETYCKRCLVRSIFAGHKKCEPHAVAAPAAPQPAHQGDALSYVHPVPDHCDRVVWRNRYLHLAALVAAAERDACAKACEYRAMALDYSGNQYVRDHAALDCARSIRARGKT